MPDGADFLQGILEASAEIGKEIHDARAEAYFRVARLIAVLDPMLGKMIEDLGKQAQANDARGFRMAERMIENYIREKKHDGR